MYKLAILVAVMALSACVTINIYFPAAAAEKAADKVIDEVWQLKNKEAKDNADKTAPTPTETPVAPAQ